MWSIVLVLLLSIVLLRAVHGFRLKPKELKPEYQGPWKVKETQEPKPQPQLQEKEKGSLDKFRNVMCYAYTGAGLSHVFDLAGDSKLLELAGAPHFQDLPLKGKVLASIWCLTGPLCFVARPQKEISRSITDASIAFYGIYEVAMSILSYKSFDTAPTAIINAVLVQIIVGYCFFTIKKKDTIVEN